MPRASFNFGDNDQHRCRVECGYFGKEQYFVDDVLVLSRWSFGMSGTRSFEAAGHKIEIRIKVHMRGGTGDAFVDGKLVATDLFSEFNASLARPRQIRPRPWVGFVIWAALVALLVIGFSQ